ncbi:DEAD/DEAH box helicase family protein [Methanosarcina horonobensis]|uniref:hypothetical protein n=1 Tax=Methanosarcina horonobensis TaxID=418008 RepID=UPI000B2415A1
MLEERRQDFAYREGEIDSVISKYRMITMCTYSFEKCNVAGIAEIVSNHQLFWLKRKENGSE